MTHIKTNRRAAAPRKALTWMRGSTSSSSGRGGSSAGRPRRAPGSMAAPLLPLLPLLLLLPPLPPGRRRPRPRLRGTPPSLPTAPPVLFVPSRHEQAISAKLRGFHFFNFFFFPNPASRPVFLACWCRGPPPLPAKALRETRMSSSRCRETLRTPCWLF